ncbi:SDR family oxidoreductase [Clostridium grantii]|uniref:Nucleoside-diphosphate-sugar epimerase n=1 Tax=Clostridium grantii DSM 8605 TaxID=1121316 RepID=A0A1M5WQ96_9CLOT|nr:SDR family oxidoreductase [Clostridium grantii]SHH89707.1 Nucleoside-diphosphate-sugar epimerase [Clostridium grantii DSM 8605]
MKALFIGGTGTISSAISKLAVEKNWDLYLLNRGNKTDRIPEKARVIKADINHEETVVELIKDMKFDVVVDFIAYSPEQIKRDIRIFSKKTKQFIFISSASAYQKPLSHYKITESTPLDNPYWKYSRDKIVCEEILMEEYRKNKFPITIVRPSHTYDERSIPTAIHGKKGSWQVIDRIIKGKPVIIHGDGSSLWTLTHSSDFAKAFVGLMGNGGAIGESVQITSDESLTWNRIYDCIGEALDVEVKKMHVSTDFLVACQADLEGGLVGDKSNSVVFDNTKIKRLVPDYVATTRFDQGVRQCVEYILSHPEVQVEDKEFDLFCDNVIKVQQHAEELFKNL